MSPSPRPPLDVPGLDRVAGEGRLDAGRCQRSQHHAGHRPVAVDCQVPGGASERRHDGGHDPIALLPVRAGDVERNPRPPAPGGAALESHCRERRREPARRNVHAVRLEREPHVSPERKPPRNRGRLEPLPGMGPPLPGLRSPPSRQQCDSRGRCNRHFAAALPLREPAERPCQAQLTREPAAGPRPRHVQGVEQRLETRRSDPRTERGDAGFRGPQRLHRVGEVELAAIEPGVRPRDLQAVAGPDQIAVQLGKSEFCKRGVRARERAGQLPPALEQMPHTVERGLAGHREVVPREENLLHRRQVD